MPGSVPVIDACSGLTGSVFKLGSDAVAFSMSTARGRVYFPLSSKLECRIIR